MSCIPGQGDLSDRWQMILNFTIGPVIPIDRLLVFTTIKHPKYDFDLVNEKRSHGPAD
jgi:hypothetical protein